MIVETEKAKKAYLGYTKNSVSELDWNDWTVGFRDRDFNNTDIKNLYCIFHKGFVEWKIDGSFRHICGFSRFVINSEGMVIDTKNLSMVKHRFDECFNYPYVKVRNDFNVGRGCGLHRCLGLSWLHLDEDFIWLDINHKDGNKNNFKLENLEWCTRSENCVHALENGLRNDQKNVKVIDKKGNETSYRSIGVLAQELGLSKSTITFRCKNPNNFYGSFRFVCESISEKVSAERVWLDESVEVLKIADNKVSIFNNSKAVLKSHSIPSCELYKRLDEESLDPYKGLIFKSVTSKNIFPKITDEFKLYWKHKQPASTPVRIMKDGEEEKIYPSINSFSLELGLSRGTVSKYLKNNRYKEWTIVPLQP